MSIFFMALQMNEDGCHHFFLESIQFLTHKVPIRSSSIKYQIIFRDSSVEKPCFWFWENQSCKLYVEPSNLVFH